MTAERDVRNSWRTKLAAAILALGALLSGLLALAVCFGSQTLPSVDAVTRFVQPAPAVKRPPRTWTPPVEPPEAAEEEDEDTIRAMQARFAEKAGIVAIRCFVGTEYDGLPLVGRYGPAVQDGWYSDLVRERSGARFAEARYDTGPGFLDFDLENPFYVTWDAPEGASSTVCTVHSMQFAYLTVEVLDPERRPVAQAMLFGCGASGRTDAAGLVELEVLVDPDGDPCSVSSTAADGENLRMLVGEAVVPPFQEHEAVKVELVLEARPVLRPPESDEASEQRRADLAADVQRDREELAILEELQGTAAEGPGAAWLARKIRRSREQVASGESILESWTYPSEPVDPAKLRQMIEDISEQLGEELAPPELLEQLENPDILIPGDPEPEVAE